MKVNKLVLICSIILITIIAVIGITKYQELTNASKTIEARIDIGGYNLFVSCIGSGKPTVIFESGLGGTCNEWNLVQQEIAKIARRYFDKCTTG